MPAYAQNSNIEGPVVSDPVSPRTSTGDMPSMPKSKIWQPGDPVRIVGPGHDRKPGAEREDEDGEPDPNRDAADDASTGRQSTPISPRIMNRDLGSLTKAQEWRPGDPVRIIQEGGAVDPSIDPEARAEDRSPGLSVPAPTMPADFGTLITDFPGIPATGVLPPDTVGDIGPNHYIQMVNVDFAIFDRAGNTLVGPSPINALWSGTGTACEEENDGDPIVQYDHLADRWLMSQFAIGDGFHECIAISQTPDPVAGGWFLYDFEVPEFPDYPKIGVWPDGYYMSTYESANLGVFAFDRTNMLLGNPASYVRFTIPSLGAGRARTRILPSDLDGTEAPPIGSPNYFLRSVDGDMQSGGADRLEIFEFSVDFNNPLSSTFTGPTSLVVDPYDIQMCGAAMPRNCIPQPATAQGLDPLSNRLMRRVQYRNFGTHESLVTNQTVDIGDFDDHAGIRWYELRLKGGSWSLQQQGDFAPGTAHRWMGSAALDQDGNLAVGYSLSSDQIFPSIGYAGRLATDPEGDLTQGEFLIALGGGSQTHPLARWGDYSSMNVDPRDDCTFWFTSEYYETTSSAGWRTRISSFKHPSCGREPETPVAYKYPAKLVCGLQDDPSNLRLTEGFYATAINILNPNQRTATFTKKLALTFPPDEQKPGEVINISRDRLRSDEALEVDCEDLKKTVFASGLPASYLKGFVIITSTQPLDVTGVYTTRSVDREHCAKAPDRGCCSNHGTEHCCGKKVETICHPKPGKHSSIDVEQITGRKVRATIDPSRLPDVIPIPKADRPAAAETFCSIRNGQLAITVRNQGSLPIGATITQIDYTKTQDSHQRATPGLLPGQAAEVLFPLFGTGCSAGAGACSFRVLVDSTSSFPESNEANNVAHGICASVL